MKPTVTIFVCVLAAGLALAQSPSIIQNTRATMQGVSNNATAASNEALGVHATPAAASATHAPAKAGGAVTLAVKPSKGSSASAKKTGVKSAPAVAVKVKKSAPKPAVAAPKNDAPPAASAAAAPILSRLSCSRTSNTR